MTTTWTPEAINRLRELWATGSSCAAIGRELGVTKNSIVGKAHKLKLDPRRNPSKPNYRGKAAAKRGPRKRPSKPRTKLAAIAARAALPPRADGYTIIELTLSQCRWPIAETRAGHRFCGAHAEGPYCARHRAVAYTGFKFRAEMPPAEHNVARAA